MSERPEISCPFLSLEARKPKPRPVIARIDLHQQEPLVVAEAHIVSRAEFLDQLPLEQQRLGLAVDCVKLEIPNAIEQRARLDVRRHLARRHEILPHPLAKVARLPHIDHPVQPVTHQVNPRLVREIMKLGAEVSFFSGNGHRQGEERPNIARAGEERQHGGARKTPNAQLSTSI